MIFGGSIKDVEPVAYVMLPLLVGIIIATFVFILKTKPADFKDETFNKKWGNLYQGVGEDMGYPQHLFAAFFFTRRILLVSLVNEDFALG
jgi:hypothetical protein